MQGNLFNLTPEEIRRKAQEQLLEAEVGLKINEFFDKNYEFLSLTFGRGLADDTRLSALQQVLMYWAKLSNIAKKVTETEVKLILPNQATPKGRSFTIEGVVDIVREQENTTMYDIKTHAVEDVENNKDLYAKQLNVYAYIWQKLRKQQLSQTAIIATSFPNELKNAIISKDQEKISDELDKWNPLVDISFSQENVEQVIQLFGQVVDKIEESQFQPPPIDYLKKRDLHHRQFAVRVCRNCDARFSCNAYISYFKQNNSTSATNAYFDLFKQPPTTTDTEQFFWIDTNQKLQTEENTIFDD